MLVDSITLHVKAGDGGNGASTFLRNGQTAKGGPDGGNGGNGGNIYFQGSKNVSDLRQFRFQKKIVAQDGGNGKSKKLFGKNAPSETIFVPIGTRIFIEGSKSTYEIRDTTTPVLLGRGGKGGRGNTEFKSATNQTPNFAEKGTSGEEKELHLELRLIANIGLIGLPNTGKSSLLKALTNALPKIGDYPFTTLEPNLGMFENLTIADIPGLIEGASSGRGLGVTFLKHIEKTKLLLHTISATDSNPEKSYETVRVEFEKYSVSLLKKPEVILITKADLVSEETLEKTIGIFVQKGKNVLTSSIYQEGSLEKLKKTLLKLCKT